MGEKNLSISTSCDIGEDLKITFELYASINVVNEVMQNNIIKSFITEVNTTLSGMINNADEGMLQFLTTSTKIAQNFIKNKINVYAPKYGVYDVDIYLKVTKR